MAQNAERRISAGIKIDRCAAKAGVDVGELHIGRSIGCIVDDKAIATIGLCHVLLGENVIGFWDAGYVFNREIEGEGRLVEFICQAGDGGQCNLFRIRSSDGNFDSDFAQF